MCVLGHEEEGSGDFIVEEWTFADLPPQVCLSCLLLLFLVFFFVFLVFVV
jgi:hypothetical protein